MEEDIVKFLDYIKDEKRLSQNTLESYQRDINQYKEYIDENKINYTLSENEITKISSNPCGYSPRDMQYDFR